MPITRSDIAAALPDLTSTIRAAGLYQTVEVVRDRWGVPHIRAATEHDAFFAQGFVTAQDRLWHMDYEVKLWRARLARVLGVERAAPLFRGYPDDGLVSVPPGQTYGDIATRKPALS